MIKEEISDSSLNKKIRVNYIFSILASLELLAASIFTLTISSDSKNAWFLGFSAQRWLLMLFPLILGIIVFISGKTAYERKQTIFDIIKVRANSFFQRAFVATCILLVLWGWCSIIFPASLFEYGAFFFERLRPLSITVGLIIFQFYLFYVFYIKHIDIHSFRTVVFKEIACKESLFFVVCLLALTLFIGITKIGLTPKAGLWNVAGVPISGLQFLALFVMIAAGMYLLPREDLPNTTTGWRRFYRFLPYAIFLGTILVWGLTPLVKHYFSIPLTSLNDQPFPYSDARVYDTGAISLLKGEANYFQKSTDKPLYMIFLGILHIIAGFDYSLLTWLQIIVLAFIPVIIYHFGKQFYHPVFGIFLAIIIILRQRNAIVLSAKISTVNPKLFVTETMTLLGIVLITYLVFSWFRSKKPWLALLSGGAIGAAALIRLNPIFLLPVIAFLALIALEKSDKSKWKQLALFIIGFSIVFGPWLFTGVDPNTNQPWTLSKGIAVAGVRYKRVMKPTKTIVPTENPIQQTPIAGSMIVTPESQTGQTLQPVVTSTLTPTITIAPSKSTSEKLSQFSLLFINHFFNNYSAAVLSLPDPFLHDKLDQLALRDYWQDTDKWQGNFPAQQYIFIIINTCMVGIGIGYSWRRYGWAGLLPMAVFIAYSISLGFSVSSGGRYIVPIDWVVYFYYGLTLILILGGISSFLRGEDNSPVQSFIIQTNTSRETRNFRVSLVGLILIASLIPIANLGLPIISDIVIDRQKIIPLEQTITEEQNFSTRIYYGTILYPYTSTNGTFTFDLLNGKTSRKFSINVKNNPLENKLFSGHLAFVVAQKENKEVMVKSIYVESGETTNLIWQNNPQK